jgi:hypothetical protein
MGLADATIATWDTLFHSGDSPVDAAVRAKGIDPATNQWIPGYGNGLDSVSVAADVRQQAEASMLADTLYLQSQIDAAHQQAGGFLADLLNPFSPNVDPKSETAKLANLVKNPLENLGLSASTAWIILIMLLFVVFFLLVIR